MILNRNLFTKKNPFKISLLGLNFSIILQKVPSKPPLKITLTNRLCKIKLNNKKKVFQNPFHSMTSATTPQTIVLESFFSFLHLIRPLE